MRLIADTGALYAVYDRSDTHHPAVRAFLERPGLRLVVPALVLAELDHLVLVRLGERARVTVMSELAETLEVAVFDRGTFVESADVAARHDGVMLGITDASVMVSAGRYGTLDILTTDQRHFRAVRPLGGEATAYRLFPFDA